MISGNWPAPAKINRFLRVVGRRDDGYHLLQTVFQFLDFGDRLGFEMTADGSVERVGGIAGLPDDDDLTVRAARALQSHCNTTQGVRIHIEKCIPVGGGLGGGSSNAATVLVALNRLWGLQLDDNGLRSIGVKLGADVPVFLHGRACWAEGVGEEIADVAPAEHWAALITPSIHACTGNVFADPELKRDSRPLKLAPASELEAQISAAGNDCGPVVRRLYPEVGNALDKLASAAGNAWLSGTGASVFALCDGRASAERLLAGLDMPGRVCQLLNQSALVDRLAEEL